MPPMSELERRLFDVPRGRRPTRTRCGSIPLPGRGAITGIVDAAYLDEKLILEADGRTWHNRQQAFRKDRLRDNEAARAGWQTLRFPWEEVVGDPEDVAATVADVLAHRGRGHAVPNRYAQSSGSGGQPTEPSIWSSMRRDHSTAYSMGSVRVTGSMKPLTIMPMACSSERPRLIR